MKKFLLAFFLCLGFSSQSLFSQWWPNDGTQRSHYKIPLAPLTHLPELHTDMTFDCLIGYIAMDSIAEDIGWQGILQRPLITSIDSLKLSARLMYGILDYDPVLLRRYITTTNDKKIHDSLYNRVLSKVQKKR